MPCIAALARLPCRAESTTLRSRRTSTHMSPAPPSLLLLDFAGVLAH
ncbi:hydrolase, partial [Xanthomonas perforans]